MGLADLDETRNWSMCAKLRWRNAASRHRIKNGSDLMMCQPLINMPFDKQ